MKLINNWLDSIIICLVILGLSLGFSFTKLNEWFTKKNLLYYIYGKKK